MPSPTNRLYLGLFGLAALPRVVHLLVARPSFDLYHWSVADVLLQQGIIGDEQGPSTEFDPLYPVFLAFGRLVLGDHPMPIQALQIAVDSLGAPLLYRLTEILSGRRRAALLAATLYACYPLLIHHSVIGDVGSLLSVLLMAFACMAVSATSPRRATMAGVCLGLAVLTRVTVMPIVILAALVLVRTHGVRSALVFALTAAAIVSPWTIRNYSVNGALAPTRVGVSFLHGNSRYAAALLPKYNTDLLGDYLTTVAAKRRPDLLHRSAAAELDEYYGRLGWQEATARPAATASLWLAKAVYFFWPRLVPSHVRTPDSRITLLEDDAVRVDNSPPRPVQEEIAYTVSYGLVAAAAVAGVWRRRSLLGRDLVLWSIACTFVAAAVMYLPATRLRVPMEFVLLFYAAVAFDALMPKRGVQPLEA